MTKSLRLAALGSIALAGACSTGNAVQITPPDAAVTPPPDAPVTPPPDAPTAVTGFHTVPLVADTVDLKAQRVDPNVVNAWGIVATAGALWVANNGTGVVTLFNGIGNPAGGARNAVLTLEPGITGEAIDFDRNIQVCASPTNCGMAQLLVASETGKVWGLNRTVLPRSGAVLIDRSAAGAIYKGIAIVRGSTGVRILATDFHNGNVDVFDDSMRLVAGSGTRLFVDPQMKPGFAPFNVAVIGGNVYVTYAQQDANKEDDVKGVGLGAIAVFDREGRFVSELASGGLLNAPWGMTASPATFPTIGAALIVGNFGDGMMQAFDPTTGKNLGQLLDANGAPLVIDGLWGITFTVPFNGVRGSDPNWMYFASGPDDEKHGLFGYVVAN